MIWLSLGGSILLFWALQKWISYRGRADLIESFELPQFQAHRGYHLDGTSENTLKSLSNAKRRGALMVEFDVRASFDGEVFLYHDPSLQRLHGDSRKIENTPASELRALGLTTLKEVLISNEVPVFLNIELKTAAILEGRLENLVVQTIKNTSHQKRIVFSSFNPFCLIRLHQLLPDIPRALLASPEKVAKNYFFLRWLWMVPYCQPDLLHLDKAMIGPKQLKISEKYKLKMVAWTVNSEEDIERLKAFGVKNYISDRYMM